ncbi:hypothetical protein SCHPADRAFT_989750 [Schizopora paradoxa]|uniref:Uncharacterized protein n=1 Tax=Schizopora paradoxa TaxID=27342 RepID=A0A0H2QZE3_9AGAM|nr:hypothetical protein SCHPADRAFT_989750 [Schizopora paradoxa]
MACDPSGPQLTPRLLVQGHRNASRTFHFTFRGASSWASHSGVRVWHSTVLASFGFITNASSVCGYIMPQFLIMARTVRLFYCACFLCEFVNLNNDCVSGATRAWVLVGGWLMHAVSTEHTFLLRLFKGVEMFAISRTHQLRSADGMFLRSLCPAFPRGPIPFSLSLPSLPRLREVEKAPSRQRHEHSLGSLITHSTYGDRENLTPRQREAAADSLACRTAFWDPRRTGSGQQAGVV